MDTPLLKRIGKDQVPEGATTPVDDATLAGARAIVDDVRRRGETALREHAERLGDLEPGGRLVFDRKSLADAERSIEPADRALLVRVKSRIAAFAEAQRESLERLEIEIPGGRAGHGIAPVERAGCYAPGGRFPLPSSVLMTAATARAAGVSEVWVASPKPRPITLAAASIAGADALLSAGGAQAIAALAFGAGPVPACDTVVGPGNRWVTAAKQLVFGRVAIDMLAGPSELAVLADETGDPAVIAADLLAQAEHDPDAVPILVATDARLIDSVNAAIAAQLKDLPTRETAVQALGNGYAVLAAGLEEAMALCDRIAPEHLELHLRSPVEAADRLRHYGGLFVGAGSAEVLGDYGAGPNHTLPTGGTARHAGGLSVLHFLRVRTWIAVDDPAAARGLFEDAGRLADLEGLSGHARAARARIVERG